MIESLIINVIIIDFIEKKYLFYSEVDLSILILYSWVTIYEIKTTSNFSIYFENFELVSW